MNSLFLNEGRGCPYNLFLLLKISVSTAEFTEFTFKTYFLVFCTEYLMQWTTAPHLRLRTGLQHKDKTKPKKNPL